LILTIVLKAVSVFLAFNPEIILFINNSPSAAWQVWSPKLSIFIMVFGMTYIIMFLGTVTFFLACSVVLALVLKYFFHKPVGFSEPFTIAGISSAMYFLLPEVVRWIILFLSALNPSYDLQLGGYLYTVAILNSVLLIVVALVFLWYMASGLIALFRIPVLYAILISYATFIVAQVVSIVIVHLVTGDPSIRLGLNVLY
jgi:hypothetical protein